MLIRLFGIDKLILFQELLSEFKISLIDFYNRIFKIKREWLKKNDLKLNLGCGAFPRKEFINIDIDPKAPADIRLDTRKPLPFKDNTVSYIYSEHFFEHIDYLHLTAFRILKDWLRLLHKGGGNKNCTS